MHLDDLLPLVADAASIYQTSVGPYPLSYESKRDLMAVPSFKRLHTDLKEVLSQDERLLARSGSVAVHAMWERFDAGSAANWLPYRACVVGSSQACADLRRFVEADSFPYTVRVAVGGVFTDRDVSFDTGLTVCASRETLPDVLQPHGILRSPVHLPTMAIVEERTQEFLLRTERDGGGPLRKAHLQADEVLLSLSLVRVPAAPFLIGLACEPADWVPLGGFINLASALESRGRVTRLGRMHMDSARDLYRRFKGLTAEKRDRVRLPMRRLNAAMRRRDDADAAADLGIALEALFLRTADTDKRYQAAIRCAYALGSDSRQRHEKYELAYELFHLRNRAVHRGALSVSDLHTPFKERTVRGVLEDGGQLVSEALRWFLMANVQEPDWDSLVLGARNEPH